MNQKICSALIVTYGVQERKITGNPGLIYRGFFHRQRIRKRLISSWLETIGYARTTAWLIRPISFALRSPRIGLHVFSFVLMKNTSLWEGKLDWAQLPPRDIYLSASVRRHIENNERRMSLRSKEILFGYYLNYCNGSLRCYEWSGI